MNRRYDFVYISVLLIACVVGYVASTWPLEPESPVQLPDLAHLARPELEIEPPDLSMFEMPALQAREMPRLHLSGRMESVLREVRKNLLASAVPSVSKGQEKVPTGSRIAATRPSPRQIETERLASLE